MAKFHYRDSPSLGQRKVFAPYLSEDEELILVTGLSKAIIRSKFVIFFLFPGIIFGGMVFGFGWVLKLPIGFSLSLATLAMIFIAFVKTLHLYHSNRYLLTTRRVIIKKGLFSVNLTAALYDKITHIEVEQSFVDRSLLHHGHIIISTAGSSESKIILSYVDYPVEFKNLMERLINRERERFGLGIRSVSAVEGEVIE